MSKDDYPVAPMRRIEGLMNEHERLLGAMLVDDSDQGFYLVVARDWDHPDLDDGRILSERYAYLTRGKGNDGWINDGSAAGGNGINRRDDLPDGKLAGALARLYLHAKEMQLGEADEPIYGDIRGQ